MPRKTLTGKRIAEQVSYASMRPRPDAAENGGDGHQLGRRDVASMRPRPDAAENARQRRAEKVSYRASMRPRPDAAENAGDAGAAALVTAASMRPRPDAAENVGRARWRPGTASCFNEAAARCRGKRRTVADVRPELRPLQ